MNLREVPVLDGVARIGDAAVPLHPATAAATAHEGSSTRGVGYRSEVLEAVGEAENGLCLTVTMVEELGSDAFAYDTLHVPGLPDSGDDVVARVDARTPPMKGKRLTLRIRPDGAYFFSARTGERLPTR